MYEWVVLVNIPDATTLLRFYTENRILEELLTVTREYSGKSWNDRMLNGEVRTELEDRPYFRAKYDFYFNNFDDAEGAHREMYIIIRSFELYGAEVHIIRWLPSIQEYEGGYTASEVVKPEESPSIYTPEPVVEFEEDE